MPASLSDCLNINLKSLKLTTLFLAFPLFFFGQSLTGLWTGILSNDSNTVRKDQSFEIALTEYRGKVYGYSRSEFIVNDTLYYILKRVKGTIEGDVCEVKDDEIISFNFPTRLDKGIKVISTFYRNKNDSTWYLAGTWKTNQTKNYYAVSGKVDLQQEKDLNASKIFPHLEELKLADDVAFYKDRKTEQSIVKIVKPEKRAEPLSTYKDIVVVPDQPLIQKAAPISGPAAAIPLITTTEISKNPEPVASSTEENIGMVTAEQPEKLPAKTDLIIHSTDPELKHNNPTAQTNSAFKQPETIIAAPIKNNAIALTNSVADKKEIKTEPVPKTIAKQSAPVIKTQKPTVNKQQDLVSKKPETKNNPLVTTIKKPSTEPKKPGVIPATGQTSTAIATVPVTETKETRQPTTGAGTNGDDLVGRVRTEPLTVTPDVKKPAPDITLKAALIAGRRSDFSQVVNFKSDSLELSLYDNGEIDGDTVSIFMNGAVIWANQGLKASAIKKTIYLKPGIDDEFTLVMFAENLGKYPPNTGLLVVHDGDDIYNLHFSSDFQMNAGIIFRRKK